jgi:predicted amidohydrolase YtcJ
VRASLAAAILSLLACASAAEEPPAAADLIVHDARVTTLDDSRPEASAFALRGEEFVSVGDEAQVMKLRGARTRVIDAGGRRVIPGLNDSHLHAVRGGRFYNL